jgi:hypothetical protein
VLSGNDNSLNVAGMPPRELHLQVGCPIILMRNLSNGLANGTRMIVMGLTDRVIEAKVATGPERGLMLRPSCCVLCLVIFGVVGGGAG